jgi:hypothetical protein
MEFAFNRHPADDSSSTSFDAKEAVLGRDETPRFNGWLARAFMTFLSP